MQRHWQHSAPGFKLIVISSFQHFTCLCQGERWAVIPPLPLNPMSPKPSYKENCHLFLHYSKLALTSSKSIRDYASRMIYIKVGIKGKSVTWKKGVLPQILCVHVKKHIHCLIWKETRTTPRDIYLHLACLSIKRFSVWSLPVKVEENLSPWQAHVAYSNR